MRGSGRKPLLSRGALGRARPLLRPYHRRITAAGCLIVVWLVGSLSTPLLIRYAIDEGIDGHDRHALHVAAGLLLLAVALTYVSYRGQLILLNQVGEGFLRDLRLRVFAHLQALSLGFYDRQQAGVLVSRMTSDVDALSNLVQTGFFTFIASVLLIASSAVVLVVLSPVLAAACLILIPPVVIASVWFRRRAAPLYLVIRDRVGRVLGAMHEGLAGVRVLRAYGAEDIAIRRFDAHTDELFEAHVAAVRISMRYMPVIEFASIGATAVVVGTGGLLVEHDLVTLGTVVAFVLYLSNLFQPIEQLSFLLQLVQTGQAGLGKLFGLLDARVEIVSRAGAVELPSSGEIVFEQVSFSYGAGVVLDEIDLTVAAGERVALVGPTGAGKSTLGKLAARFYDPTAGSVSFGGVDLRDGTLGSLRDRIVVVPQEGFLFTGTLSENIRLGRDDASDADVRRALEAIGALARFSALPRGLETQVESRGARFSAGERQLVALARVALADPGVIVLDEATSSLDPVTEREVEDAVELLARGRTLISIAHRLTTAERADRVILVDGGRIVEDGPHAELVARGGRYAQLYSSWVGGKAVDSPTIEPAARDPNGGAV